MDSLRRALRRLVTAAGLLPLVAATACRAGDGGHAGVDRAAAARGATLYLRSCAPCHGRAGQGIRGLGADLRGNAFVAARSDQEVIAFLARGRRAGDPDNRSRVDMPPRGGNPGLTDADLAAIVAWLRSLDPR